MISNHLIRRVIDDIRRSSLFTPLDDVFVAWPDGQKGKADGRFYLKADDDGLALCWDLPREGTTSDITKRLSDRSSEVVITTPESLPKITATTDTGLCVEIEGAAPMASAHLFSGGRSKYSTRFDRLHFPAMGSEKLSSGELRSRLKQDADGSAQRDALAQERFTAIIPNVELRIRNSGTDTTHTHPLWGSLRSSTMNCLAGKVHGADYCIEQSGEDLVVQIKRSMERGESPDTGKEIFEAILNAVGFINGCHPWPCYYEHQRDHVILTRWGSCAAQCASDALLPVDTKMDSFSKESVAMFESIATFLASGSNEAKLFTRSLWLIRASQPKRMPFEVRILTLCSVLEGLIENLLTEEDRANLKKTGKRCDKCRELPSGGKRERREEKWKTLADRLGVPWDAVMKPTLVLWDQYRHPLAHGFDRSGGSTLETDFDAYSRLSGAIYALMVTAAGYRGPVSSSFLHGERTQVGRKP